MYKKILFEKLNYLLGITIKEKEKRYVLMKNGTATPLFFYKDNMPADAQETTQCIEYIKNYLKSCQEEKSNSVLQKI